MYETRLSRMIMQLPPAQMANRDGDAGMETMLWDINIIPNELDNGYLMLPPGVLHMSALGRFGRFTLFSPHVSHSKHLPVFFVLCCVLGLGVCCFVVFLFPVLQVFGIPNSPRSLDLDDRQGFIASSAMQQKKKELRRAASGLVKVICRTEESRPGGRGKKPGKPKKKGLLASFEEWFGSINMMNILYVWFPASWGPSVVEAIQTRNVTCLAKKPIVRDPHIFDRKEAARGSRAREVTCRIQKWNIKAEGFHPILVANARVDWLAMDDDDITKKFPILLEGILQDVFSQRAAFAWQGAQPQKLTVSMLLPGTSSAAEWRDLLQSRRQFWPTLTTRHASLVPVSAEALH